MIESDFKAHRNFASRYRGVVLVFLLLVALALLLRGCVLPPDLFLQRSASGMREFDSHDADIYGIANACVNSKRYAYPFDAKSIREYAGSDSWEQFFAPMVIDSTTVTIVFPGYSLSVQSAESTSVVSPPENSIFIGPLRDEGHQAGLFVADFSRASILENLKVFGDDIEARIYPASVSLRSGTVKRYHKVAQTSD